VLGIVGMAMHGFAYSLPVFLAAGVLRAVAVGSIPPSLQAASIKRAGAGRVGVASSTFYLGADIGQGIGPFIAGAIAGSFGYGVMFYFCAALILVGMLMFAALQRQGDST
jgi:MFS family permease